RWCERSKFLFIEKFLLLDYAFYITLIYYANMRSMKMRVGGIIVNDNLVDMSRIYPTKQKTVKSVLDILRGDKRIASVMLMHF
ncbi:MAG: hypothetical protein MJ133_07200, partial [Lachnospiraceae bacterium]|nr:hypothetical protein [Lachnospiraceae bacterium]